MKDKEQVKVPARHERTVEALCGFADTSGISLGSTTHAGSGVKINLGIGV